MDPEQLFLALLPFIDRRSKSACRGRNLNREDTEDFCQLLKMKLVQNDYAVLRNCNNKELNSYISIVAGNALRDYCNHLWGKWRPRREVERMGEVAVRLARMIDRDQWPRDQAVDYMHRYGGVAESRQELAELAELVPITWGRRLEGEEALTALPATEPTPEETLLKSEGDRMRLRLLETLERVLRNYPPEDVLIMRMCQLFTVTEIARTLKLEAKPLFRRRDKLLRSLREDLERAGIERQDVRRYINAG